MKLIDFTGKYQELLELYNQTEDSEAEIALEAELDSVVDAIEVKAEACAWMMKQMESESEAFDKLAKHFAAKAKYRSNAASRLKDYIAYCLMGNTLKTKSFSFGWRKSVSVEVLDEGLIPEQYKRIKTVIEPEKKLIKQDIEAGATIPGVCLKENMNLQVK